MDDPQHVEAGARRLLDDLAAWLLGPGRPLVHGGFRVQGVTAMAKANPWAPTAMCTWSTVVVLHQPIVWEAVSPLDPPRDEVSTANIDQLRQLVEDWLASGRYPELHAGELADWTPELPPDAERRPRGEWTVTARIRSLN